MSIKRIKKLIENDISQRYFLCNELNYDDKNLFRNYFWNDRKDKKIICPTILSEIGKEDGNFDQAERANLIRLMILDQMLMIKKGRIEL